MALAREVLTDVLSAARVSTLVITGTDTGVGKTVATAALACHARLAGIDVAVCKPVQTGSPRDDDLADIARLSGVTDLRGSWRYPEPLAPVAAAQRAGLALPTRVELVGSVREASDAGAKLVLVEGAGGLLVELGEDGVTLRDVAMDLAAPVLRRRRRGTGHVEPHRADVGSACFPRYSVRRTGDRRVACRAGPGRGGQLRGAGQRWLRCARRCPTGAGVAERQRVREAQRFRVRSGLGRESWYSAWCIPSSWSSTRTPRRRSGTFGMACARPAFPVRRRPAARTPR